MDAGPGPVLGSRARDGDVRPGARATARRSVLAVAVVLSTGVGACGSDGDPARTDDPTTSDEGPGSSSGGTESTTTSSPGSSTGGSRPGTTRGPGEPSP